MEIGNRNLQRGRWDPIPIDPYAVKTEATVIDDGTLIIMNVVVGSVKRHRILGILEDVEDGGGAPSIVGVGVGVDGIADVEGRIEVVGRVGPNVGDVDVFPEGFRRVGGNEEGEVLEEDEVLVLRRWAEDGGGVEAGGVGLRDFHGGTLVEMGAPHLGLHFHLQSKRERERVHRFTE